MKSLRKIEKIIIAIISAVVFILFIVLVSKKEKVKQEEKYDENSEAVVPETRADSLLIRRLNFFVEQNVRLENYILYLERENGKLNARCNNK